MGTDRLYQVLPIMRELKKERREDFLFYVYL